LPLRHFPRGTAYLDVDYRIQTGWQRFWQHTGEHLMLVGISLSAAIALAIPLDALVARRQHLGQFLLGVAGIIQTILFLALFVFMIKNAKKQGVSSQVAGSEDKLMG
jgi:ABC-type proline/glycine betaine transport system permease subunit